MVIVGTVTGIWGQDRLWYSSYIKIMYNNRDWIDGLKMIAVNLDLLCVLLIVI